ncbi:MAG: hypothetical protein ACT4UQ_11995 [Gammaproteobacteria bacterium]
MTFRINVEDGVAVVSGSTVAQGDEITIQRDAANRSPARSLALAVAAAAGSQVLAFPAASQDQERGGEVSAACKVCGEECGNPIFYPEDGSCPNPIFYPESMIAIGGALAVGVVIGAVVCYKSRNSGPGT